MAVYALSGLLVACGGVIMTAWLGVAAPTAADDYELDIITAAVIGGTSLFGGAGSVFGVVLGALLMQVVRTGMVLLGLPTYLQIGAIGMMIMLMVLIDNVRRRRLSECREIGRMSRTRRRHSVTSAVLRRMTQCRRRDDYISG
ncbi:MAG: hypothetical protein WCJ55_13510 [Chloroflexales bacterium]